jgi:hypothetical protein
MLKQVVQPLCFKKNSEIEISYGQPQEALCPPGSPHLICIITCISCSMKWEASEYFWTKNNQWKVN